MAAQTSRPGDVNGVDRVDDEVAFGQVANKVAVFVAEFDVFESGALRYTKETGHWAMCAGVIEGGAKIVRTSR